jgi:hypothetical protein
MILFVMAEIEIGWRAGGMPEAHGGVVRVVEPWAIDPGDLAPVGYVYSLR